MLTAQPARRRRRVGAAPTARSAAFSPFVRDHTEAALALVERMMERADAAPGDEGLAEALDLAEAEVARGNPELARHALMIFITHDPKASRLPIASLEERHPEQAQPQRARGIVAAVAEPEERLAWFREDPLASQHHEHWHVVYPTGGVPDGSGRRRVQDRQGELFFYMHQQMLARYETERAAADLPAVRPFGNYTAAIAEGYDPELPDFAARPANAKLADVELGATAVTVTGQARVRDALRRAVRAGTFVGGTPVAPDPLGATVEPSIASAAERYGNLHGLGHVLIALAHDPTGASGVGPMWTTRTAIMDPVFYRWHRHVDDLLFAWQEGQAANDFADRPAVTLRGGEAEGRRRSPDLFLVQSRTVPGSGSPGFDLQAWARSTFGGRRWASDPYKTAFATTQLETGCARGEHPPASSSISTIETSSTSCASRTRRARRRPSR